MPKLCQSVVQLTQNSWPEWSPFPKGREDNRIGRTMEGFTQGGRATTTGLEADETGGASNRF